MTSDKEAAEAYAPSRADLRRGPEREAFLAGCAHVRAEMAVHMKDHAEKAFLAGITHARSEQVEPKDWKRIQDCERAAEKKVKAAEDDALDARNSAKYWADRILIHERAAEGLVNVVVTLTGFQRYSGFVAEEVYTLAQAAREALAKWEASK